MALLMTVLVLIQGKGTGLSSAFGGSFSYYRSKRGVERVVFISTILVGIAIVINTFVLILTK